jgi:riboflavin kinase/FMN adenylyltransferase
MPEATALTIGNFDGVHVGHGALVRRAQELAGKTGQVIALAFDPHPMSMIRPQATPERITTFGRRAQLLRELGCDEVVRLVPTVELLGQMPDQFMRSLVERYRPAFIVEGDDFRFGKGRAGDVRTLAELGGAMGFRTEVVGAVEVGLSDHLTVRASSSIVRWLLTQGRVRDVATVLGRPYELAGTVVKGEQLGRTIGFPTANLSTECLLPADGVYAGLAELPGGNLAAAAINIGTRPTVNGAGRRAEAHLMPLEVGGGTHEVALGARHGLPDYGWALSLRFVAWLRDDLKFESVDVMVDQIRRDCARVNRVLAADLCDDPHLCAATSAAGKGSFG